jgi:hypothetical protein
MCVCLREAHFKYARAILQPLSQIGKYLVACSFVTLTDLVTALSISAGADLLCRLEAHALMSLAYVVWTGKFLKEGVFDLGNETN